MANTEILDDLCKTAMRLHEAHVEEELKDEGELLSALGLDVSPEAVDKLAVGSRDTFLEILRGLGVEPTDDVCAGIFATLSLIQGMTSGPRKSLIGMLPATVVVEAVISSTGVLTAMLREERIGK